MSPLAALRHRRSSHDLPPETSDDELLAWSETLVRTDEDLAAAKPKLRLRFRT